MQLVLCLESHGGYIHDAMKLAKANDDGQCRGLIASANHNMPRAAK
jgi:hypothetical protein